MILTQLLHDETGFIVSAELVLVATILVIGLIVGLSEVQHAVVQELNDVGDAIGSVNQSFFYTGFAGRKRGGRGRFKAVTFGSAFRDSFDDCDNDQCALSCMPPIPEGPKFRGRGGF